MSVAAAFLPLADHLGYELCELVALCSGLLGAAPGVAAARLELARSDGSAARALGRALAVGLAALAVPVVLILLNALRRPPCDPVSGLVLYLALPVPSALLASALGVASGFAAPRRAGWIVAAVFAAALVFALWPVARGPQVFAFDHLGGMFPGPIYDEAIRPTRALWIFRAATVLYAGAGAGIALLLGPTRRRRTGTALLALCGGAALALSSQAERFHWKASEANLDSALGGTMRTEHLVLHFPREKTEDERHLLAIEAEVSWRAVREFAGLPLQTAPVHVFLYRNGEEKRLLIGAAETSFTKPWLRQIHMNDGPVPLPILRHELAHAAFADIARGPFGVPSGLVPQMALVEGAAVAADWPAGEFTVHEEARALRDLKLLPDLRQLFARARFYAEAGPRAYTAAGSAIRFLWESRGAPAFREVYATGSLDVETLAASYSAFLDRFPSNPRATPLAQQRYAGPGIVHRPCPHEIAELQRQARNAPTAAAAEWLWARCAQLEPDDPEHLVALWRAQLRAGDLAAARETERRALAHPKLSQPLRAAVLTESGDALWRADDANGARERYERARELVQPEPQERGLVARLWALADRRRWAAARPLFTTGAADAATLVALAELQTEEPLDGLPSYLLAKQMQNRGAWAECARLAGGALERKLPSPLFVHEALRMLGLASWHLGDDDGARAAFQRLGAGAPPGRANEAQRWLQLVAAAR